MGINKYIVLLRGVTPSGKNKVPMAQLKEVLYAAGYDNARVLLHTGNIILDTTETADQVAIKVHELVEEKIGANLAIIVRTPDEIRKLLADNPFAKEPYLISRVFFVMMQQKPDKAKIEDLLTLFENTEEQLSVIGKTAYMYIPGDASRSKLSNNFLEKKLGVSSTMRNYNTLSKLLAAAEELKI